MYGKLRMERLIAEMMIEVSYNWCLQYFQSNASVASDVSGILTKMEPNSRLGHYPQNVH